MDVKQALTEYNGTPLTILQVAHRLNFTKSETNMIDIYWEYTFNDSWIYLSSYIINECMGYKKISDFYNTILYKYTEHINYKEIYTTDPLFIEYKGHTTLDESKNKPHTGGSSKKYYAITGLTFKMILMQCKTDKGKEARLYYLRIEELSKFIERYNIALHEHIMQKHNDEHKQMLIEHKQMLIEQKQIIAEKDAKFNRINTINMELVSYKKSIDKDESIFIVATYNYATQGVFKVGRTKDMKNRLSGLNLTHISGDKVFLLHEFKVNDSLAINHYIHKKLKGFAARKGSEFFICQYNLLKQIIELIIDGDESYSDIINSIIDDMYNFKSSNHLIADWTRGITCNMYPENSTAVVVAEPIIEPIDEIIDEIIDEPIIDEPIIDDEIIDDEIIDEPIIDEPIIDEPIIDEPIIDDHVSDQIVDQVIATIVDNYVFNFASSTDEQKKEYTLKCIKDYKTTLNQSDEILWKKFQVYLIDQLKIQRYKFKSLKWKAMYMDCID